MRNERCLKFTVCMHVGKRDCNTCTDKLLITKLKKMRKETPEEWVFLKVLKHVSDDCVDEYQTHRRKYDKHKTSRHLIVKELLELGYKHRRKK